MTSFKNIRINPSKTKTRDSIFYASANPQFKMLTSILETCNFMYLNSWFVMTKSIFFVVPAWSILSKRTYLNPSDHKRNGLVHDTTKGFNN